jgi:preprotein translocase subunit SecB
MSKDEAQGNAAEIPVQIMAQYIRDISFENPLAPDSLKFSKGQPDMDVNIGLDARKLEDKESLYEVVLSVRAEAIRGDEPLFICEIHYGMTVRIGDGVPEDRHHPLLFIEIPRQAFPYVRQIVSTLVSDGGFPPLFLAPVDFHQLYLQRFKDDIEASQKAVQEKV